MRIIQLEFWDIFCGNEDIIFRVFQKIPNHLLCLINNDSRLTLSCIIENNYLQKRLNEKKNSNVKRNLFNVWLFLPLMQVWGVIRIIVQYFKCELVNYKYTCWYGIRSTWDLIRRVELELSFQCDNFNP